MQRSWSRGQGVGLLLCTLALLLAQPVRAEPPAEAAEPAGYRETVEQAITEYAAQNFEEASSLFASAHRLFPNARTLRGLGITAFELRRYEECIRNLEAALGSEIKPLTNEQRVESERLITRARGFVATLTVDLRPPSATLLLDGAPVDAARPLLVPLGEHLLEARLDRRAERRTLRVRGGELLRLSFVLDRPALASAPSGAVGSSRVEKPARPLYRNGWLWTGVGAVVIGAAVAGVLLAMGDNRRGEDNDWSLGSGRDR